MPDIQETIQGLYALKTYLASKAIEEHGPVRESLIGMQKVVGSAVKLLYGEWISTAERKPDKQTPVLVYVPPYNDNGEEYIGYVGMAYYTSFGDGFWAGTDGNLYGAIGGIHEPSHWMPLPDKPTADHPCAAQANPQEPCG